MHELERLRQYFPDASFGAACSEVDILRAEEALGEPLPGVLRELYLAFDGFRMAVGGGLNALLPLFGRDGLVEINRFFRSAPEFPTEFVSRCLFFGDDGIGGYWGIKQDLPGKVVCWDAEWGADFEVDSDDPLAAWLAEKQRYEAIETRKPGA
jgi:hypothetical protein